MALKKGTNKPIPVVVIYTDGACSPNPGVGGWAGVLRHQDYRTEIYGGFQHTSSNRMEMMAFIKCLETLTRPHVVKLFSDSRYLVTPLQQGKVKQWVKASDSGKFVKNIDLWKRILYYTRIHNIQAAWVKGHNKNTENERCDQLARMMRTTKDKSKLEEDTAYITSARQPNKSVQPAETQPPLLQPV